MNSIYFNIFVSPGQQAQAFSTVTSLIEKSGVQLSTPNSASNRVTSKDHLLLALEQASIRALQKHDREGRPPVQTSLPGQATTYAMRIGPDGQRYAVSGELQVNTSPGRPSEETQLKARLIEAAEPAADPSNQDRSVPVQAQVVESQTSAAIIQRSRQSQRLANQYQSGMESGPSNTWDAQA